ncbi:MAG: PulJ/GspJ family protein [Planctomycetota bacterium]
MPRKAFTLLEVTIATLILAVLLTAVAESLVSGHQLVESIGTRANATDAAHRVIHRLTREIQGADIDYVYYSDVGGAEQWSFQICTGFDSSDGSPIYDASRVLAYDADTGELTLTSTGSSGTSIVMTLARDLAAFDIDPKSGNLLSDNFLTVSLTRRSHDRMLDQPIDVATERKVFLRSTNYDTDGFAGPPASPADLSDEEMMSIWEKLLAQKLAEARGEVSNSDTDTESVVAVEPSIAWGTDSEAGDAVQINNTINLAEGMRLESVSVSYEWNGNYNGELSHSLDGNILTVTGISEKKFDMTIEATAVNADGESKTTTQTKRYN